MTVFLDSTALLARYIETPEQAIVRQAMASDHDWCACALALAECLTLIDRIVADPADADDVRRALRDDWQRFAVIPVDQLCLDRAGDLGRTQPIRMIDALHLAAADRLSRPVTYVTFDPAQIPAALGLEFEVVST
jgi:predicted nucleic acid-binding protein